MEFIKKSFQHITLRTALVALAFWVPVGIFLKLAGEIIEKEPLAFDVYLLEKIHSYATPFLDTVFITITNIGGIVAVILITLALAVFYFYKRRYSDLYFIVLSVTGASITNLLLKVAFQRDRPSLFTQAVVEQGFSFPSGHAMASAALVTCLVLIYFKTSKRWAVIIFGGIAVFLIGLSRLYLGVHYPSDIIAGWSVSVIWVLLSFYVTERLIKTRLESKKPR